MAYSAVAQTWVTLPDLISATGLDLSAVEPLAERLLVQYAGEVESYLSRPISVAVTDELAEMVGAFLITRYRPVIDVDEVDGYTEWDISTGVISLDPPLAAGTKVLVSYTAAFTGARLEAVRSVAIGRTLRALVKEMDDAVGTTNVAEEGHSDTYEANDWSAGERTTLDSLRRRVGAS